MPPKKHSKPRTPTNVMELAQAKMQGAVTGFILAIKGNMKSIGCIAFGIVFIYIGVRTYCQQREINNVWKHSANWAHKSDITNAVEQINKGESQ